MLTQSLGGQVKVCGYTFKIYAAGIMINLGLNIEQRKRLTIGVELVSKPKLLLFFDDVTSELDSVTSWAVLELLQKLAAHGQAIICAVSQPPASFLERFDRVLILGLGGKPVYFGEVGKSCATVREYFEGNGATSCPRDGDVTGWIIR
jgi:ATP-binding cassette subfamily G (WHITE) protein 2 (PDR)